MSCFFFHSFFYFNNFFFIFETVSVKKKLKLNISILYVVLTMVYGLYFSNGINQLHKKLFVHIKHTYAHSHYETYIVLRPCH